MMSPEMEDYDYFDAFTVVVNGLDYTPKDLTRAFMMSPSKWVAGMFVFRNKLAGMVGLKTPDTSMDVDEVFQSARFEVGEKFGLFHIYKKNENEVILGENDSHLDFRLSIHQKALPKSEQIELTLSTGVVYNNWVGRAYFVPVRFFHVPVAKSMMRRMVGILEMRG